MKNFKQEIRERFRNRFTNANPNLPRDEDMIFEKTAGFIYAFLDQVIDEAGANQYEVGYREGSANVMADFIIPLEGFGIEDGENDTVPEILDKVWATAGAKVREEVLKEAEEYIWNVNEAVRYLEMGFGKPSKNIFDALKTLIEKHTEEYRRSFPHALLKQ